MSDNGDPLVGLTLPEVAAMMAESQFWSPSRMQEYQRLQLRQLLLHAKNTTPFYKTRLDCLFQDDGELNWENWLQIPLLQRKDLQNSRIEMQSTAVPAAH